MFGLHNMLIMVILKLLLFKLEAPTLFNVRKSPETMTSQLLNQKLVEQARSSIYKQYLEEQVHPMTRQLVDPDSVVPYFLVERADSLYP